MGNHNACKKLYLLLALPHPLELYPSLLKEKNVKIAQKSIFPDYEVKFKLTKLPSLKEYTAFTNV